MTILVNPTRAELIRLMKKNDSEIYLTHKGSESKKTFYYVIYSGPQQTKNGLIEIQCKNGDFLNLE